jgi:hypothetical protein
VKTLATSNKIEEPLFKPHAVKLLLHITRNPREVNGGQEDFRMSLNSSDISVRIQIRLAES